jgi:hypothetical protein
MIWNQLLLLKLQNFIRVVPPPDVLVIVEANAQTKHVHAREKMSSVLPNVIRKGVDV